MLERELAAVARFPQDFEVVRAGVFLVEEDGLDPGALEDVGQVVGAVGRVDVDQDGADACGGDLQVNPLDAARGPHANAVSGADAETVEAGGGLFDLLLELVVGEAQVLVAGDDGVAGPVAFGGFGEDLRDCLVD